MIGSRCPDHNPAKDGFDSTGGRSLVAAVILTKANIETCCAAMRMVVLSFADLRLGLPQSFNVAWKARALGFLLLVLKSVNSDCRQPLTKDCIYA